MINLNSKKLKAKKKEKRQTYKIFIYINHYIFDLFFHIINYNIIKSKVIKFNLNYHFIYFD